MAKKQHPQSRGMDKKKKERPLFGKPFLKGTHSREKRKQRYIFRAITREWMNGVPQRLRATKEERIAFFNNNSLLLSNSNNVETYVDIPINMLEPAKNAKREKLINIDQVAQITVNFAKGAYSAPNVSVLAYKNKDGKIVDVRYFVTNGIHRMTSKIEQLYRDTPELLDTRHEFKALKCHCTPAKNEAEVAEAVRIQNAHDTNRLMDKRDNWRIAVEAGQETPVYIANMVAEYGFDVTVCLRSHRGWPYFESGQTIATLCDKFCGEDVVRRALALMADKRNKGLYQRDELLSNNSLFGGLCIFIDYLEKTGYAHEIGLRRLFAQEDLIDKVIKRHASVVPVEIKQLLHMHRLEKRDENIRYQKVATALAELYAENVPQPNAKYGKGSSWKNCPSELRQLYHVAPEINDDNERAAYILARQLKLKKTFKIAATWPAEQKLHVSL